MATQSGFANLKVIGPIDIPNNSETVIHTMVRSGLVFVAANAAFNQDLRGDNGMIFWRVEATAEPGQFNVNPIFGRGILQSNQASGANFVPAGAQIRQRLLRQGGNPVSVYLYILEFDTAVANFGSF